jgi:hypothetical protein
MKTFADAASRTEVLERLRAVRADTPRKWGRMTAHQMICHCADACRMACGETTPAETSGPLQRTLIKWIALYAPVRWPAGRIDTVVEMDQLGERFCGVAPGEFAADVATLEALLARVATQAGRGRWPRHPIFGHLSEREWLRWAYLHMDHHLRQFGA